MLSRYSRSSAKPIPPIKPDQDAQHDVARLVRTGRPARNQRRVHDSNIGGPQSRRDARFLQFLKHAVVELLVGVGFSLQNVVLHQLLGHLVHFGLLLVQRLLQQKLALARAAIFGLHLIADIQLLARDQLIEVLELRLQPHDLGILRPVLVHRVGILRAQCALLL